MKPGQKVGRKEPCPCGSGVKYKSCCFAVDRDKAEKSLVEKAKKKLISKKKKAAEINALPIADASPVRGETVLGGSVDDAVTNAQMVIVADSKEEATELLEKVQDTEIAVVAPGD
jgi:hypothetical protein